MEYQFTNEYPPTKVDEIIALIAGPRLWIPSTDYPDFMNWAERAHGELKQNSKRALLALSGSDVIGALIYQRHKSLTDTLELKNLTVRPDARGRYIASFLMRNAEREGASEFHTQTIVCDAKTHNTAMHFFLARHHYRAVHQTDLYGLASGTDTVYLKSLAPLP